MMFSDEVISSTVYLKENKSLVVMLSQLLQHSVLNIQKKVRSMSQKNQKNLSCVELVILRRFCDSQQFCVYQNIAVLYHGSLDRTQGSLDGLQASCKKEKSMSL